MHDMRSACEIEAGAARLDRQHEERRALVFLEFLHEFLPLGHRSFAVENETRTPERRTKQLFHRRYDLLELGEHQ